MLHPVERRMPMYSAKFKVGQAVEGKIATPVKQGGRVWQMFLRALAAK